MRRTLPERMLVFVMGALAGIQASMAQTPEAATQAAKEEPRAAAAIERFTRSFKVNPNLLLSVEHGVVPDSAGESPLQAFLKLAGLDMAKENAPRVFLSERTGLLMVQGTLDEIALVEAALKKIQERPVQVLIEVQIAAVPDNVKNAGLKALVAPPDDFTHPDLSTLLARGDVPSPLDPALLLGPSEPDLSAGIVPQPTNFRTDVFTSPKMRVVIRALEQSGCDMVSPPRVTTISGRQARIAIENEDDVEVITDPPFHAPRKGKKQFQRGTTE